MEYQKIKKSLIDLNKDVTKKPLKTVLVLVIIFALYLLSIIIPGYVNIFLNTNSEINKNKTEVNLSEVPKIITAPQVVEGIEIQYLNSEGLNPAGEPYSIEASYPIFGIKDLDKKIEEVINAHVAVAKYGDSNTESHFVSSFEQPYMDSRIISIEMSLVHYGNDPIINQGRGVETIIGINYDRIDNRFYSIDDLTNITGLSLKKISSIVSDKLDVQLEPKIENFSNFIINKDEVVFIYQKYQVTGGAAGSPRISVKRILK